ncbi:MAG TPA: hypothetical protein VH988_01985 [Thermoanaerobaculia bacterium]|jgi:hypothetical protein|nr:hypothetical protein [Thermoanaerobaculia bacterium]
MEPNHFEALRARLEDQLRADVELLHEAHRVKLRAFETVWRAQAEVAQMQAPPAAAPVAPAGTAEAGSRTEGWSVLFSIQEKMGQIPEVFDKNDIAAALGFMPKRATLFRAFDELRADGWIQDESPSEGRRPARYRKLAQPDSDSA